MATMTANATGVASGVPLRGHHVGVNFAYGVYSLTATLSVGDIIEMVKIPHGGTIVDFLLSFSAQGAAGTAKFNVGDATDHDRFIASAAAQTAGSARINTGQGVGYKYTVSDDATTRYKMVRVTLSDAGATATSTGHISLLVLYTMDPIAG